MSAGIVPTHRSGHAARNALLVALAVFGLLWLFNIPYRSVYQPDENDTTALADGLLLVPGARWEDWFTQGHSHFFDAYPEWPWGLTGFARPAFQFLLYLAHFVFGREWSAYLAINYVGVAGVAAVAFAIARTALGVGTGAALLSAVLVLLSPAVLEFSIWQVGFASEPVASVLVGCAFLAVIARRDLLCLALLMVALLTKETAVWAPFAAALSVLLRADPGAALRRRAAVAAAMLLPVAFWLGLRFTFYGGIGGTYATADYSPFTAFLGILGRKLVHLQNVLVSPAALDPDGRWASLDRAIRLGTALLVVVLLLPWAVSSVRMAMDRLMRSVRKWRWPLADAALLVTLWGALGFVFYFVIALPDPRYTASAVLFVWPAAIGELMRRRAVAFRIGLAACCVVSVLRASHALAELNPPPRQSFQGEYFHAVAAMNAALRQVPPNILEVYVVSAGGIVVSEPSYLSALLGIHATIVHVSDMLWDCSGAADDIAFDHDSVEGVVTLSATAPECAGFIFTYSHIRADALADGRIQRSDSISYEFPDAPSVGRADIEGRAIGLGRRMIVHIRPHGPARFLIEEGGPGGSLVWFDTP